VAAGLFDYFENIFIVSILTSYPNVSEVSILFASTMTIVKSVLTTAFFVLLITVVILNLKKKWKRSRLYKLEGTY
jgi:preprotein translocase subunit SecG